MPKKRNKIVGYVYDLLFDEPFVESDFNDKFDVYHSKDDMNGLKVIIRRKEDDDALKYKIRVLKEALSIMSALKGWSSDINYPKDAIEAAKKKLRSITAKPKGKENKR